MLVFACFSPHPPLILPQVGLLTEKKKVEKTIQALKSLALKIKKAKPDLVIISSPHPDWGFNVPLHFLIKKPNQYKIKAYLTDSESATVHFQQGMKVLASLPEKTRVAWIASGDMSHCLKKDGPYGFHPAGPEFDKEFIRLLKAKDINGILNLPKDLVAQAGECGLRSFCMALGALKASKNDYQPEVLSYESPFGVGYLTVNFKLK